MDEKYDNFQQKLGPVVDEFERIFNDEAVCQKLKEIHNPDELYDFLKKETDFSCSKEELFLFLKTSEAYNKLTENASNQLSMEELEDVVGGISSGFKKFWKKATRVFDKAGKIVAVGSDLGSVIGGAGEVATGNPEGFADIADGVLGLVSSVGDIVNWAKGKK